MNTQSLVQVITCRAVICAVPVTQLQNRSITFAPLLPVAQQAAIDRIRMGNAVKIFGIFSSRFWPEGMWDVVCTHRLLPELWMTSYPVEDKNHVGQLNHVCVTAFCTGKRAATLGAMSPASAVDRLIEQLNEVFGTHDDPTPATRTFVRGYMRDWSKEPFIGGAYTHPSLGAKAGDRNLAASNLGNVVFFAGEHCQSDLNPCMQGAMQTGDLAAAQVYHALNSQKTTSRL